jgi:hypothetical protein
VIAPDWLAEDACRRVDLEAQRAAAWLLVRRSRDPIAIQRIRERVKDAEAFSVLVGCYGRRDRVAVLLADLTAQRVRPAEPEPAPVPAKRRRVYAVPQCGTISGYETHRKRKQPVCDPCRVAYNTWRRERRRAQREQQEAA